LAIVGYLIVVNTDDILLETPAATDSAINATLSLSEAEDVAASQSVSPISPLSPVSPINSSIEDERLAPEETQAIIDNAISAQQEGDYSRAIELANSILEAAPDEFLALNIRGSAYLAIGDTEQALADYSQTIQLSPFISPCVLQPWSCLSNGARV
jgi:tetratricopeptide (TPR) repeat protein